jgi:hypothetical protein
MTPSIEQDVEHSVNEQEVNPSTAGGLPCLIRLRLQGNLARRVSMPMLTTYGSTLRSGPSPTILLLSYRMNPPCPPSRK